MIIGLTGLVTGPNGERGTSGAGKDTVVKYLIEKHDFVAVAIADSMKRFCVDLFGFRTEQLWSSDEKKNERDLRYQRPYTDEEKCIVKSLGGKDALTVYREFPITRYLTPCYALQKLGDWGRDCFEDVWINRVLKIIKAILDNGYGYSFDKGLNHLGWFGDFYPRGVVIPDVRFINEMKAIKKADGKLIRIKRNYTAQSSYFDGNLTDTALLDEFDDSFDVVIDNNGTLEELYEKIERCLI